jgi:hypothetical protein
MALWSVGLVVAACTDAGSDGDRGSGSGGKAPGGSSGRGTTAGASASGRSGTAGGGAGASAGGISFAGTAGGGGRGAGRSAGGSAGVGTAGSGASAASGRAGASGAGTGGTSDAGASGDTGAAGASSGDYDAVVLADGPVAYWAMNHASGSEPDLTVNGRDGSHEGGSVELAMLPNGDQASDFDGESQYVSVPSHASFSISTTGNLTWEAWIRPDELQFPNDTNGYVNWMGKCAGFSQNCEWEARMYATENGEDRCNRISAYVFNQTAGLGSAADWQPECGLIEAGSWYHVVGEYTTESEPNDCQNADQYPGSIEIWVNGVKWDHGSHGQTGCMSQYDVIPGAYDSPLNIGTMAEDGWFPGAIGKVAIYDKLLPESDVLEHYQVMTGEMARGTCGGDCNFD